MVGEEMSFLINILWNQEIGLNLLNFIAKKFIT